MIIGAEFDDGQVDHEDVQSASQDRGTAFSAASVVDLTRGGGRDRGSGDSLATYKGQLIAALLAS